MPTIRIFFSKKGEASYISHLDLQRVMARALRKSGIPVWYSQGFNPHIYMTFALPLPIMQESDVETVDCKHETEIADFSEYIPALNAALPSGIVVYKIAEPKFSAKDIAKVIYRITYSENLDFALVKKAVSMYNLLGCAFVTRKTKRSETKEDLKAVLPEITLSSENYFEVALPAGVVTFNPNLLTSFLEENFNLPSDQATILRTKVITLTNEDFC